MAENPVATSEQLHAEHYTALFLQMAQREAHRFGQLIAGRPDHQLIGAYEGDLEKRRSLGCEAYPQPVAAPTVHVDIRTGKAIDVAHLPERATTLDARSHGPVSCRPILRRRS